METTTGLKRPASEMLDTTEATSNNDELPIQIPPSKKVNRGDGNNENVRQVLSELVKPEHIFYSGVRKDISSDFCSPEEHICAGKFFCKLITSKSDL